MPPRAGGSRGGGRTALLVQNANAKQLQELVAAAPPELVRFSLQRADRAAEVRSYTAASLPQQQHEWAFQLVRDTLKELYEPVWGWKDESKREQLRAPSSRFLVAWADAGADGTSAAHLEVEQQRADDTQQTRDTVAAAHVPPEVGPAPAAPPSAAPAATPADPAGQGAHEGAGSPQGEPLGPHLASAPAPPGTQHGPQASVSSPPPARPPSPPGPAPAAASASSAQPTTAAHDATASTPPLTGAAPVAYVNFRFEEGYAKDPVLYIYEVMVADGWQRLGLASRLIRLAEHLAWEAAMDRVVLTVLSANQAAQALYKRQGFRLDKHTPDASKGYVILSKERPASAAAGSGSKAKKKRP